MSFSEFDRFNQATAIPASVKELRSAKTLLIIGTLVNVLLIFLNFFMVLAGNVSLFTAVTTLVFRGALGFGIYKGSRVAAIFALAYSVIESGFRLVHGSGTFGRALMVLGFVLWFYVAKAAFTRVLFQSPFKRVVIGPGDLAFNC
jgi:hypothetical protein